MNEAIMKKQHAPILAVGNAIVDIIALTDDEFLQKEGMNKGGMQLLEDAADAARLYERIGPATEISGGSAANTVVGIVSCGGQAGFIGKLGHDDVGAIFAKDITAAGVEYVPCYDPEERTGNCIILVTPDAQRTMNTHLGATRHLLPEDIDPERVAAADWVYLEGYSYDAPSGPACFSHVADLIKGTDTRLAFSLSDAWCVERHHDELLAFIDDHIDLLFGNQIEIEALTGLKGEAMLDAVAGMASEVAVTFGEEGSVVVSGTERIRVDAKKGISVVDTTGAGDLFAAGYLHARQLGGSLEDAAMNGTAAAAEIISHVGARPEQPLSSLVPFRGR